MRIRIHPHVADLAGSGLVLIGLLLAAMIFSAVPALVQGLVPHAAAPAAPDVSGPARATS